MNLITAVSTPMIEIEQWLACEDTELTLSPDRPLFVGIDMALRHDSVAIVYGQKDENDVIYTQAKIWLPQDENFMDYQEIEAFVVDLMKKANNSRSS